MKEIFFDSTEFKNSDAYSDFMNENKGSGILKVQAYTANQAFPLEGVIIEVYEDIGDQRVIFFRGVTDNSGIIDNIILPTKKSKEDILSSDDILYTRYKINATYPNSNIDKTYEVGIFDDIKIIQPIRIPITSFIEGDNYSN